MDKETILDWFFNICFGWIMALVLVIMSKLAFDFLSAPNIFIKKEVVVEQSQKQIDEMCVAWWFESDLGSAKKRVCGK
jgi:hypothetical protein